MTETNERIYDTIRRVIERQKRIEKRLDGVQHLIASSLTKEEDESAARDIEMLENILSAVDEDRA